MRPLIKINQTYRELAAAIAAAITRSKINLFHHKGRFYTEDFNLLSPERFTSWLESANICSFYTTSKEPAELSYLSTAQAKIILESEVFLTTFSKLHSPSGTKDPASIAAAIERAGIILLRDSLGGYYTIEPRKGLAHLSAERLTTWLPQHTGLAVTTSTARSILSSAELAAISTPFEPRLPLTPSQLEDIALFIASKIQH